MDDLTYCQRAGIYADEVLDEDIPACKFVKQSCERFINDLSREDIYLDLDVANKWCRLLETFPHVKGKWAAKNETLKLSPYQIFCTVNMFGWKNKETGLRRYREAYIEVPRKSGKTFWVAGVALGMMTWDGEYGAEVYCGATSERQALEVFTPARAICLRLPEFSDHFDIIIGRRNLAMIDKFSKFEPIIGNPGDGASPSCGIADEFHEHRTTDLVDTLVTGMGARDQPMMIYITTAGSTIGGPCYQKRSDVINILAGTVQDDTTFGIIYTIDEADEWDTIESQIKANPNYGISVNKEFLAAELEKAKRSPSKQVTYKTKYLNCWVGAKLAWMNMLAYQACQKNKLQLNYYSGQRCFIGIDLASKTDVASMSILFPPSESRRKWACFVNNYLPEDTVLYSGNTQYRAWHAGNHIITTPGNVLDYSFIEDDLKQLVSNHDVVEVIYDPFQATQFSTRMVGQGIEMIEYGATVKNFSEPMKELEALILKRDIMFTKCPVLMWMFGNVVAKLDKKDNIFPNRDNERSKIDGVVAIIMSLARTMHHQTNDLPAGYEMTVL